MDDFQRELTTCNTQKELYELYSPSNNQASNKLIENEDYSREAPLKGKRRAKGSLVE